MVIHGDHDELAEDEDHDADEQARPGPGEGTRGRALVRGRGRAQGAGEHKRVRAQPYEEGERGQGERARREEEQAGQLGQVERGREVPGGGGEQRPGDAADGGGDDGGGGDAGALTWRGEVGSCVPGLEVGRGAGAVQEQGEEQQRGTGEHGRDDDTGTAEGAGELSGGQTGVAAEGRWETRPMTTATAEPSRTSKLRRSREGACSSRTSPVSAP
ncbi:hypothetical protein ABDE16_03575 [Streptomyces sp. BRB040]|uniref:hypothetical protein n=1 Tax=Streptomyces sp. BRB040 TaxID=3142634 RepID=UPI0031F6553F